MASFLIFMIMIGTKTSPVFEGEVKGLPHTMAKSTLIKIKTDSKTSQNLNFKNISQYLIIQAIFHQLQGLLQKSKQGSIFLVILQTRICQGRNVGRISHNKEVAIDFRKSLYLMIIFYITKSIVIDF